MIATEPLPEQVWARIGLAGRETFTDQRHLIIYGQRTADGRLAFGGRGAPYHFGSRIRPEQRPRAGRLRRAAPGAGRPAARDRGGARSPTRGAARSASPATGAPRWGWTSAPGWPGQAATSATASATTNLAGRTLADLVLDRDSDLVRLPWVDHRSPRWEPEPLRWLGVSAALAMMTGADAEERRTGRPSRRAALLSRVLGH